ncbi:hypothetical protein THIOM_003794 [Candidatus Thiomargarita nelsonii]|uniref:Uncharacterized protein n=1 Tax=Candidatus Thiomargarita nelsonii TaxID=1003181 RepID=A0A176RXM0_9GAMM|nr:hypothetical protein THIOM_003794 [Candidatus Thiomargarita nelsonii]
MVQNTRSTVLIPKNRHSNMISPDRQSAIEKIKLNNIPINPRSITRTRLPNTHLFQFDMGCQIGQILPN